jgi:phosphoadenosine phosphosulfate reductase
MGKTMSLEIAKELEAKYANASIEETLKGLANDFDGKVAFSTSFGQEDQAITHIILDGNLPVRVFTLDTGRLFQETYDVFDKTVKKYGNKIEVYFPEAAQVEKLLQEKGPNSFYNSVEDRKECCNIRKIEPLVKALKEEKVWITGLRSAQSEARSALPLFQWDERFQIIKFNPLTAWSLDELNEYLEKNSIPQNTLHKRGYISIGCAPCTVPIEPGQDLRAGRWPWDQSHKECGLHAK